MSRAEFKTVLKQLVCGLVGHWKTSASVTQEDGATGYHSYCHSCKKTFLLSVSDKLTEKNLEFLLNKI